mgnify:CR=1 FL=1
MAGIAVSIPFGIGAARNLVPAPVYLLCRAFIAVSRSFQEIIIAILFVAMLGFGPLAGTVTLAFATIGFLAKLLAEIGGNGDQFHFAWEQRSGDFDIQVRVAEGNKVQAFC